MLNCSRYDDVLFTHIILTILSTNIIFDNNSSNNSPEFHDKKIKYPQIPLYDPKLKILLDLNFKTVMTGYILVIIAYLAKVRSSNRSK